MTMEAYGLTDVGRKRQHNEDSMLVDPSLGLYVVDKRSGQLVQSWNPGDGITSRPTLVGSTMYLLSNGGVLYAMNIARF